MTREAFSEQSRQWYGDSVRLDAWTMHTYYDSQGPEI